VKGRAVRTQRRGRRARRSPVRSPPSGTIASPRASVGVPRRARLRSDPAPRSKQDLGDRATTGQHEERPGDRALHAAERCRPRPSRRRRGRRDDRRHAVHDVDRSKRIGRRAALLCVLDEGTGRTPMAIRAGDDACEDDDLDRARMALLIPPGSPRNFPVGSGCRKLQSRRRAHGAGLVGTRTSGIRAPPVPRTSSRAMTSRCAGGGAHGGERANGPHAAAAGLGAAAGPRAGRARKRWTMAVPRR